MRQIIFLDKRFAYSYVTSFVVKLLHVITTIYFAVYNENRLERFVFFGKVKEKGLYSFTNIRKDASNIISTGKAFIERINDNPSLDFQIDYQTWYSLSCRIIERLIPERLDEFKYCYLDDSEQGNPYSMCNYFLEKGDFYNKFYEIIHLYRINFERQLAIIVGVVSCMDSFLLNIKNEIIYEYQADEIDVASDLSKVNLRAAGVICRFIIEKHLKSVSLSNSIHVDSKFKNPGFADYITALKISGVIQESEKKKLEYLKEIGNLCAHDKGREPKDEEVTELIEGTKWCVANIMI